MAKKSVEISQDPNGKRAALLEIAKVKQAVAQLERALKGIKEAPETAGVTAAIHPEPKRRLRAKARAVGS